jgi:hypothetical protein
MLLFNQIVAFQVLFFISVLTINSIWIVTIHNHINDSNNSII